MYAELTESTGVRTVNFAVPEVVVQVKRVRPFAPEVPAVTLAAVTA